MEENKEPKQFDKQVHIRDPKTGKVIQSNHYRMFMQGRLCYFERPVKSGNFFYESGEAVPNNKIPPELIKLTAIPKPMKVQMEELAKAVKPKLEAKPKAEMKPEVRAESKAAPESKPVFNPNMKTKKEL